MILKVLSYNIHKGIDHLNFNSVLGKIKAAVQGTDADLVLLQEVRGSEGDGERFATQFEYLADQVWHHFAYGKNSVYSWGHHGNAILSKYPIKAWENIDISAHEVESRGVLHAEIDMEGTPLHVLCLHLGLLKSWRQLQLTMVCDHIKRVIPGDAPLILGGDFNDWRGTVTDELKSVLGLDEVFYHNNGRHAATYPGWLPLLKLDRIYFRGFKNLERQTLNGKPWSALSDHLPLLAKFERQGLQSN
jgi:endonuclease/exonuclease/phosphatase family metal-dependent hydrolase